MSKEKLVLLRSAVVLFALLVALSPAPVAAGPPISVDLSIDKDDGSDTAIPGETVTYTITVSNPGPGSNVIGATVTDDFPDELLGVTWTCVADMVSSCTAGPVAGDISDTVDIPSGGSVVYTATGTVDESATGTLFNSATVTVPSGYEDPDTSNNTDTDTDILVPTTDLAITKDDGADEAVPGETVTYTLEVSNNGPLDVVDATVEDAFPSSLSGCMWECVATGSGSCTAGPVAGDIADTVDLPEGDTLTYTATCTVDSSATGTLVNTASVEVPSGITDSDGSNDEATDSDDLTPEADLAITKDDGDDEAVPGEMVTYVITVSNPGPSDVDDATVTDDFPDELTCTTTCTPAGGASCSPLEIDGDVEDTVDLPAGDSVTYTAECTVDSGATGDLINTATVAVPDNVTELDDLDNSDTDTNTLTAEADLSITKDDGQTAATPGDEVTYEIEAANAGPSDALGATVGDLFPAELDSCTWTCQPTGGAVCSGPDVQALAIGATGSTLFAGTDVGLFRSVDGADNWSTANSGLDDLDVRALAIDPVTTSIVYVGTAGGVFRSTSSGSSWSERNTGLTDTDVQALAIDPSTTSTLYAGTATGGVFQSLDSGDGWAVANTGLSNLNVRSLAIDPDDSTILYAATAGGVFKSTTSASGWSASSTGLTDTDVQALAIDPSTTSTLYAGTASGGVFQSLNSGDSWTAMNTGLSDLNVRSLAIDPDDSMILYAATAGGVFKSTDGGGGWSAVNDGLTSLDVSALGLDPSDTDILHAGTPGGVFRTSDAASEWEQASEGITSEQSGDIDENVDLPAGSSALYTASCTILGSASGSLANTATVTEPAGVTELDDLNNSATDTDTLDLAADLSITKDDGQTTAVPGESVTYTITVANDGPSDAEDATVSDSFPAVLTCTWECAASGGASCTTGPVGGDISDTVDLPAGSSVEYTAICAIDAAATGTLENTATVAPPASVIDPDDSNDEATDSDLLVPEADLAITKDDGQAAASPGDTVTYTITASNDAGPSDITGATVTDNFPAELTCDWTCSPSGGASCTASGDDDIDDTVDLPVGSSVEYMAVCTIDQAASGTLVNTATVAPPDGSTDPDDSNDSATDEDALGSLADVSVTKDDGVTTVIPGDEITYTITVANVGPSDALATLVTDDFPEELSDVTWTCKASGEASCTAAGSGDLAESVDLPSGTSVTFTAVGTVAAGAVGELINTATAAVTGGVADPDPDNNSATDTDEIFVEADLAITKTDGQEATGPDQEVTYTITVTNHGPQQVTDAAVSDVFPDDLLDVTWTCEGSGGATCTAGPVAGDIADLVFLPAGAGVVYTATGTVDTEATGTLVNTATVTAPDGVTDPESGNNSATDEDAVLPLADLSLRIDAPDEVVVGHPLTLTVTADNAGFEDVTGAMVISDFAADLHDIAWTCEASAGAACAAAGAGELNEAIDLEVGASVTFTVTGTVALEAVEELVNSAQVLPPGTILDPEADNNTASVSTGPVLGADLAITKTDSRTVTPAGGQITYTIEVTNLGFLDVTGAEVTDLFPAELSDCEWTCEATDAACESASGTGDIVETVDIDVDGTLIYTATCTVADDAVEIVNTATVALPVDETDPVLENNTAIDQTVVVIFADGFESGNFSSWPNIVGSGEFEIELLEPADRLAMQFRIDGEALAGLRLRPAFLLAGRSETGRMAFLLELRRVGGDIQQRAGVRLEDGGWARSDWVRWDAGAASLELDWRAAWSSELADGELLLSLDGELLIWLTQLDSGVDKLRSLEYSGALDPSLDLNSLDPSSLDLTDPANP